VTCSRNVILYYEKLLLKTIQNREKKPLESVLQVNRNEWQAFLEEFSELTKNYELLLSKLDLAQTRIQGQEERSKQLAGKSSEALRQIRSAMEKICKETEDILNESERGS
jgi:predicted  nucleic acid-binding Zn-ribbon protein